MRGVGTIQYFVIPVNASSSGSPIAACIKPIAFFFPSFRPPSSITITSIRTYRLDILLALLVLVCASFPTALGKCRTKTFKKCGWDFKEYLTRSGYSSSMNIKKCAKWCKEKDECYSFSVSSVVWGPPGQGKRLYGCSLYKDKNPRKVKRKGSCGLINCS
jgi:hypothetical protein